MDAEEITAIVVCPFTCRLGSSLNNPICERRKIMRPEKSESALLRVHKIVELVDAAQDCRWHNLAQPEIRFPASSLYGSVVVQSLYGVR